MIVGYKADLTIEEQLQSLRDNIQLALNEQQMLIDKIQKTTIALSDATDELSQRVTALEQG